MLGLAAKVSVSKEHITIVGDGSTQADVAARVRQIKNLAADTEADYEKEKLNERIARLSGGVAVIQVRACACAGRKAGRGGGSSRGQRAGEPIERAGGPRVGCCSCSLQQQWRGCRRCQCMGPSPAFSL